MNDKVKARFNQLLEEGVAVYSAAERGGSPVFDQRQAPAARAWMLSAVNLIETVAPPEGRYVDQARKLVPAFDHSVKVGEFGTLLGIFKSASAEWQSGFLEPLESRFAARTLASFVRDAAHLMAESPQHYPAAAVLASAVLEDSVRRLCLSHGLSVDNVSLEGRLDALKGKSVITKVSNKRLKGFAGVRDAAFHAHWEQLSPEDVSQLIEATEDFLEAHFGRGSNERS